MENRTNRITTKEAAQILGISDRRVRQMILNGQLSAKRFGRTLTLSRSDVERLRASRVGRPKKRRSAKRDVGNEFCEARSKSLDDLVAESNITPWTDADFKRAAELGGGLFDSLAEQVRRWRDQNETMEAERWARPGLYMNTEEVSRR
jgi:excisionase family DNA binding protein